MSWKEKIKTSFEKNAAEAFSTLKGSEQASFYLEGEDSQFVRLNASKVRQTTAVEQTQVTLTLQTDKKLTKISFPLTGDLNEDRKKFLLYTGIAKREIESLPENPYPVVMAETGRTEKNQAAQTPDAKFFIDKVYTDAESDDFVGYMASGPMMRAIANSKGTYHWYSSDIYFVDYSLFNGQKAVTSLVSGSNWDDAAWKNSLSESRGFLHQMQKPAKDVPRGEYNVYLAPGAVGELAFTANWGGFSQAAFKQGSSALRLLFNKEVQMSEKFSLKENYDLGVSPSFNSLGELASNLTLIEKGRGANLLTSSKTAAEFGVISTGADESETCRSLEISSGTLKRSDIFKKLGTGLYLSNLHYVNWSDQKSARMTGMTRYACFWVENGDIVAPIKDLRFDVSLYEIWGSKLLELTDFQETSVQNLTYASRGFGGKKVPGMLIKDFKFTL